ncbi:ABC transporter substrate-binding protein [Nocardioides sp. Soil797]|nr:ABC transporter substrate-binding protein [Nocardioides sp. Soil797]
MRTTQKRVAATTCALLVTTALTACTVAGGAENDAEVITVGYQSKTINTVTAGTLLKEKHFFEDRLEQLGAENGKDYQVKWLDYDTGAPITAQMLAGKIDIGSMGDYPMLINGSRAGTDKYGTEMISVTGYNAEGALNGVVVPEGSSARSLRDLEGGTFSASLGSAGHGTLVQALEAEGIDPEDDVSIENQEPSVGASALQAGSVDAVAQFVAWPGLLTLRDDARLVYDGGRLGVPTLHGTVTRKEFAADNEDVVEAFLQAQGDATDYLHREPMAAAQSVAKATGLPVEVVYLYNGRNGISTFDLTLKDLQRDALDHDLPFLESVGVLDDPLDLDEFVNDSYLRDVYGTAYDADAASTANPAAITGKDRVCGKRVKDPALAAEVWVDGEPDTRPAATPECLLQNVRRVQQDGGTVRAAYAPDALTGTRWFADKMVWLRDGARRLPFATAENAAAYRAGHPDATDITWHQAVEQAR